MSIREKIQHLLVAFLGSLSWVAGSGMSTQRRPILVPVLKTQRKLF